MVVAVRTACSGPRLSGGVEGGGDAAGLHGHQVTSHSVDDGGVDGYTLPSAHGTREYQSSSTVCVCVCVRVRPSVCRLLFSTL